MIGAWALIRGNTVLGCSPSTITQHRFSNQETVIKKKTHGPSRLDTAGNFPVRAEISESFKNVAYSKYQPVPQFYFFDRLYGMFCQFVISLIHRSCAVDQITAFSSFQYKYTIYFLHCMFFLLLVSWNTFQSWFLKQFFIASQFKNKNGGFWRLQKYPLEILLGDTWEIEFLWWVGGEGGGWRGGGWLKGWVTFNAVL